MKLLIIQVGNPVDKSKRETNQNYFYYPSLLEGEVFFDEKQIINNVQTREGLREMGHEVEYYFHTRRKKISDLVRSSLAIRRLVRKHKPDVTHIYWGGISGFFAILFCPGKTVVSLLGSDLFGYYHSNGKKILSSRLQTLCSRITGFLASRVVVMSSRMKRYMWNSKSENIVVIPEGLILSKFTPGDKSESRNYLNWEPEEFIVIFFYEGQAVKNMPLAQKAFDLFKERNPNGLLKIIKGFNHDELVHVYRGADVLLMTSYHEGSNNSVKEAMACNLPVISVACGDAEERLLPVKNCFVCDYKAEEIASKMEVISENRQRSNGSDYINQVSIPNCSAKVERVYKELMK